jgi:hypothetical protein
LVNIFGVFGTKKQDNYMFKVGDIIYITFFTSLKRYSITKEEITEFSEGFFTSDLISVYLIKGLNYEKGEKFDFTMDTEIVFKTLNEACYDFIKKVFER